MSKASLKAMWRSILHREAWFILLILFLNIVFVSPDLMPAFAEINPYDEAKYIESGSMLTRFELRELAWGPLLGLVYAPFHLVFGHLPDWFLVEAWAGRIVLFTCLWLSIYYLGTKLRDRTHSSIVIGILFVNMSFLRIVANQSDALYASISALALAKVISYYNENNIREIWIGSALIGLSILTRPESIVLVPIFVAIILLLGRRSDKVRRLLTASLLPTLGILAVFIIAYRLTSGGFDLAVGSRAYCAFEQNQPILAGGESHSPQLETQRLYGTVEDNKGSVIRAILRNPTAFAQRILGNAAAIPDYYLYFFGKRVGPILLLFAFWGAYVLFRDSALSLLAIMFLWSLPPMTGLGLMALHLIPQVCYIPVVLGAVGIYDTVRLRVTHKQGITQFVVAIAFALYGLLDHKPAFLVGGIVLVAALGLAWLVRTRATTTEHARLSALMFFLAGGLILRGSYPFPNLPVLGESPEEEAIYAVQQELPPSSRILVQFPGFAIAAGMQPVQVSQVPSDGMEVEDLEAWLVGEDIRAIYLDRRYGLDEVYEELIAGGGGEAFRPALIERGMIDLFFFQ